MAICFVVAGNFGRKSTQSANPDKRLKRNVEIKLVFETKSKLWLKPAACGLKR